MATILVAEPDPDVAVLIEQALVYWGHEPVRYRPGAGLPEVDVMVLEPGIGARGVAVAEVLAASSVPVPVVVVSIQPVDSAVQGLRPVAYVLKPFTLRELRAAVDLGVQKARRYRALERRRKRVFPPG